MPLLLNQLQATKIRRLASWVGAWVADVDVVLDETGILPSGPVVLTVGTSVLLGTVDPRGSGSFAKTAKVRVVAGGGGWDTPVLPLPFQNPAGVFSTAVYAATAAEVLETVVDVLPKLLGATSYQRTAGPASRVFGGSDWYVNAQGVTFVGPRLPLPYDPTSVEILTWDPLTRIAELASDSPIEPGTILLDPLRFDGPLTIRDVEQTWGEDGARATCGCADKAGSRLAGALSALVREKAGIAYLKQYVYRVVIQDPSTGALALQIVDADTGAPDAIPVDMWLGVPGVDAKLLLGSEVLVVFANGDPGRPAVVGFKGGAPPLELQIDALSVKIGPAAMPVVMAAGFLAWALQVEASLLAAGHAVAPLAAVTPGISSTVFEAM